MTDFFGDNKPILSGAIHYFRVHPLLWRDRLEKLCACGFNTVETYIPWNFHEPKEGKFNFDGLGDICLFIKTADEVGLKVIIRPGPYICAEWDFGGLPAWLKQDRNMRLRCYWPSYVEKLNNWFNVLIPKLTPYLLSKGGPVIAMQVENEYGSYGRDKKYLGFVKDTLVNLGIDCLLFTSDGPTVEMLEGGTLPGVWKTANFGSNPESGFSLLRKYQPEGPDMCMEFWCGWFDHWGIDHHTRDAEDVADVLERMIKNGGYVNIFMFHGGTNFGFWNGANEHDGKYFPTTTSYDYCAPVTEAGDLTDTYFACKKVLEKYFGEAPKIPVANSKKKAYGTVKMEKHSPVWAELSKPIKSNCPLTMEEVGQEYGFILYRTQVDNPLLDKSFLSQMGYEQHLRIKGLRDRAVVFVNGEKIGVLYRNNPNEYLLLPITDDKTYQLDILVENMGRVNYGHDLGYECGIDGHVRIGSNIIYDWEMYSLPFEEPPIKTETSNTSDSPMFYSGTFEAAEICDTFLNFKNFGRGFIFVNGFNIGRYWDIGPANTLYIPAPFLVEGKNEIIIFETDGVKSPEIYLVDSPVWIKAVKP